MCLCARPLRTCMPARKNRSGCSLRVLESKAKDFQGRTARTRPRTAVPFIEIDVRLPGLGREGKDNKKETAHVWAPVPRQSQRPCAGDACCWHLQRQRGHERRGGGVPWRGPTSAVAWAQATRAQPMRTRCYTRTARGRGTGRRARGRRVCVCRDDRGERIRACGRRPALAARGATVGA